MPLVMSVTFFGCEHRLLHTAFELFSFSLPAIIFLQNLRTIDVAVTLAATGAAAGVVAFGAACCCGDAAAAGATALAVGAPALEPAALAGPVALDEDRAGALPWNRRICVGVERERECCWNEWMEKPRKKMI